MIEALKFRDQYHSQQHIIIPLSLHLFLSFSCHLFSRSNIPKPRLSFRDQFSETQNEDPQKFGKCLETEMSHSVYNNKNGILLPRKVEFDLHSTVDRSQNDLFVNNPFKGSVRT